MILRILIALALLGAHPADAHIVASRLGDFYAGALHPLTGLEDVLLWLALGILAGLHPPTRARWLVLLFPAGLLAGLALGLTMGLATSGAWPGWIDPIFMIVLGALIGLATILPTPVLYTLALALAVLRGLANAAGVAPDTNQLLFATGLAIAGYAAIALITASTLLFRQPGQGWRLITLRAAGSWIAAIGIMVGGLAVRGL